MNLLVEAFNPMTTKSVMCANQVHVNWDGVFSDCDFNMALELPLKYKVSRGSRRVKSRGCSLIC